MEKKTSLVKARMLFVVCTLIGILLFLVPVRTSSGSSTLIIAMMADSITAVVEPILPYVLAATFTVGSVLAIVHRFKPIDTLNTSYLLKESFLVTDSKLLIRVVGTVFFIMTAFQIGPEFIIQPNTGGTVFSLMVTLGVWHFLSFYLFTFLMDFGAMDFVGTIIKKIMRPVFTLPGNSAIDCMASWVGNGPFGVIITKLQYKEGYYTKREAAVVASCFSLVSISFSVVVAKTLDMMAYFGPCYLSITTTTLLCAFILPRVWPLNRIPDVYCPEAPRHEDPDDGRSLFAQAVDVGTQKAADVNFRHILRRSTQTAIDFFIAVFPVMMAAGTTLLIVSEYTPVIKVLAKPMEWLLVALNIPEAQQAAPALLIGFVDNFLPAVVGSSIASPFTRFIICSVSIAQIIYMTEVGSIIMKSRDVFDLPLWKLIVLFIFRTIIAVPVAILFAHLFV